MKKILIFIIICLSSTFIHASCKQDCQKESHQGACNQNACDCVQELSCGCIIVKKCQSNCCEINNCNGQCLVRSGNNHQSGSSCKSNSCNKSSSSCRSSCKSNSCNKNNSCNCFNPCNTCTSCFQNNFQCGCFDRDRISDNWEWPHSNWP